MSLLRRFLTITLLLITCTSQATSLSGTVANTKELSLYYISNFLTGEKTVVAQCTVSPEEHYRFDFESSKLRTYYINLGSRQARITIAPKQNLILDLPDYAPLRKAEYLNPYFEKEVILVYDNQPEDINYDLMDIELTTARQLKRVLESQSPEYAAQSAIDTLTLLSQKYTSPYLKEYTTYNEAFFFRMTRPENVQAIKQNYLRQAIPDLQNTAFTSLCSSEYHNPFLASDGYFYQSISNAILDKTLPLNFSTTIGQLFKIKSAPMAELIAVKGFYDAAQYAPNYQKVITQLMQQLEGQLEDPDIKTLCHSSRIKIEQLMVGNPAPYHELFTLKGKRVPTVLKRRHVLLAFINTNIFECQKQLRLLEQYKEIYKRQLEIVVVTVYQDETELDRFLKRNSFKSMYFTVWQNNEQLLDDYNVKALPSYFLTGKDGNIIYAPLSSPEESMLEELQQVMGY